MKLFQLLLCGVFFLSVQSMAYAALPGEMHLKYGYDVFTFPTRMSGLYREYDTFTYKGVRLSGKAGDLESIEGVEKQKIKGVDRSVLYAFLREKVVPELETERGVSDVFLENGRVAFSGDMTPEVRLEIEVAAELIVYALEHDIDEVFLPVTITPPQIQVSEELKTLGITEMMEFTRSNYRGSSADREHNIEIALAQFNGIMLQGGEEVSFNDLLGPVDASTGYKKELVIKGIETIPEFGGGVCQVSSTLYRLGMVSSFDILERRNHSFSVNYYAPYGSDATIYPGVQDLRMRNAYNSPVAIIGWTRGTYLYFMLLGSSIVPSVDLFGPYITNRAYVQESAYLPSSTLAPGERYLSSPAVPGFVSTWYRKREETVENYVSIYKPRPSIYKVGGLSSPVLGSLSDVVE